MSQTVDRLKELLFDSETRTLTDINHRVDTLFERAGTQERFSASVASVLDSALRKAEVDRHSELADAIAPLVVRTVRTEIRNSREELVEALYPVTGRMVKAYVASALKDLADEINRRLEANPVMLRLRSLASGKSVAELAMAEAQKLSIVQLLLVRRGTGELVGQWPEDGESNRGHSHAMSGVLTAINEFSSEALRDEGSALRQIDLGERQLYLRASETYLLAAECSGTAPAAVETILDEAFLTTLEAVNKAPPGSPSSAPSTLLAEVSNDLTERVAAKQSELSSAAAASPLAVLAWLIGLPLAAWLLWQLYAGYRTEYTNVLAQRAVAETREIQGYPTTLAVERLGYAVTISGLAPSEAARSSVIDHLQRALPSTEIRDRLSVLPSGLAEVEPRIAKVRNEVASLEAAVQPEVALVKSELAGLKAGVEPELERVRAAVANIEAQSRRTVLVRAMDRTNRRLSAIQADLARMATFAPAANKETIDRAQRTVAESVTSLATLRARAVGQDLSALSELTGSFHSETERLRLAGLELSTLMVAGTPSTLQDTAGIGHSGDVGEAAEDMAAQTERLATISVAVSQTLALKASLPPPVAAPVERTPREQLEAWTRANAVFFGSGTDYRNPAAASATLDRLAALIKSTSALVRVVGYTDDKGQQTQNTTLSQARAQKVADELVRRGVPARQLVAVGRLDVLDLSPTSGDRSPNRRVQFEVGFDGEVPG